MSFFSAIFGTFITDPEGEGRRGNSLVWPCIGQLSKQLKNEWMNGAQLRFGTARMWLRLLPRQRSPFRPRSSLPATPWHNQHRLLENDFGFYAYGVILTGLWGSIQGDIIFTKNSNARFRVITGANNKKSAPKSCQEHPIRFRVIGCKLFRVCPSNGPEPSLSIFK